MAIVYEVLSSLLELFTTSLWKVISMVRVWALSAHGICNRFGVKFYVCPVSIGDMSSFQPSSEVIETRYSQSQLCNLLI